NQGTAPYPALVAETRDDVAHLKERLNSQVRCCSVIITRQCGAGDQSDDLWRRRVRGPAQTAAPGSVPREHGAATSTERPAPFDLFRRSLALDLAPSSITVNMMSPGRIETELL